MSFRVAPRHRAGCVLSSLAGGYWAATSPLWGMVLVLAGMGGMYCSLQRRQHRGWALLALVALAAAGAYFAAHPAPVHRIAPSKQPQRWRGQVTTDPRRTHEGLRLTVELNGRFDVAEQRWRDARGRVLLQISGTPEPPPGRADQVFFRSRLRPPTSFRNPGNEGYAAYLRRRGVTARAHATWPGGALFVPPAPGEHTWARHRRQLAGAMSAAVPGQAGAVLRALALGDRSALAPATVDLFRRTGTSHVLAISGLHLGILLLLLLPALRALLVRIPGLALRIPAPLLARAGVVPALVAYAALSGFQTSTVRALVMALLLLAAGVGSRRLAPASLLAGTATIMALITPEVLPEPAFQLSLAALAGLFWLAPALEARLLPAPAPLPALLATDTGIRRRLRSALRRSACLFLYSGCAALTTLPLALFHFGRGSALGFLYSPPVIVLLGFLCLPLTLAGVVVAPVSAVCASGLWHCAGWLAQTTLGTLAAVAPFAAQLRCDALTSPAGVIGAFCLLTAACLTRRQRAAATTAALLGVLLLLAPGAVRRLQHSADPNVHLWVLDVGQGQAVVLRLPGERWVVVDGGGFAGSTFDVGRRVVIPALEALGARRLWLAVSTHPHPDHVLGLPALVRWGAPQQLWLPAAFSGDHRYRDLLQAASEVGSAVDWRPPRAPATTCGQVELVSRWVFGPSENDRSLVLRVRNGEATAVLAADVEIAAQRQLLAEGFPRGCDLLVAPHHGAASGLHLPFLHHLQPNTVFISAGGRPGLPAGSVIRALQQHTERVFSTHREGYLHAVLPVAPR